VVGLDEAYLDIAALFSPARGDAPVRDIRRRDPATCSVGIGPNKLVAKGRSDAEKSGRV